MILVSQAMYKNVRLLELEKSAVLAVTAVSNPPAFKMGTIIFILLLIGAGVLLTMVLT